MLKALIVDDDIAVIHCIQTLIKWEKIGYDKIFTAMSGQEAFEIASQEGVDVIISDLKMPVMGGMDLVRKIREDNLKTEIILLSAYEDFSAARDGIELKIYDYLLKPLVLETLERLSDDLSAIAQKRKTMIWVGRFLKDELDKEILGAFRCSDTDYIKSVFDALENLDETIEGERIFHLSAVKIVNLLCDYFQERAFGVSTIKYSKEKMMALIKNSTSRKMVADMLLSKIESFITNGESSLEDVFDKDIVLLIKKKISQNYMNDSFGITDISQHFHYSRDHINRIFKEKEGISINKYIINYRLERAKKLLLETDMPINDVSKAVGYNSTSYFTSSFRNLFGITPSDIREEKRYMQISDNPEIPEE